MIYLLTDWYFTYLMCFTYLTPSWELQLILLAAVSAGRHWGTQQRAIRQEPSRWSIVHVGRDCQCFTSSNTCCYCYSVSCASSKGQLTMMSVIIIKIPTSTTDRNWRPCRLWEPTPGHPRFLMYNVFHKIGTPLCFCNNFFKCWSIWMKNYITVFVRKFAFRQCGLQLHML